jgi:hypothetical protein
MQRLYFICPKEDDVEREWVYLGGTSNNFFLKRGTREKMEHAEFFVRDFPLFRVFRVSQMEFLDVPNNVFLIHK